MGDMQAVTANDVVLATLEGELREFPARTPATDLYAHLLTVAQSFASTDRAGLINALQKWLDLRTEPRTMIAVDLVEKMALVDLRPELERLRDDIMTGKSFLPYYTQWVDAALARLCRSEIPGMIAWPSPR